MAVVTTNETILAVGRYSLSLYITSALVNHHGPSRECQRRLSFN